ncbi:MAG: CBS domain-containing protein [Aigarchaeota archaeon]|nr:CBS domain-containing protein [Candidatus Pelearchaeum maunauluense]
MSIHERRLLGRSGVIHEFSEVIGDGEVERVVDVIDHECNEIDILKIRVKALDVGAIHAEIRAPSFTEKARTLAEKMGIDIRNISNHEQRTNTRQASTGKSSIFSDLFVSDVLKVSGEQLYFVRCEDPVIMAAMYLAMLDAQALAVLGQGKHAHGVFTGYNFISLLISGDIGSVWKTIYTTDSYLTGWKAFLTTPTESLESLLHRMHKRRWGYALVLENDDVKTVIGVIDIAKLLAQPHVIDRLPRIRASDVETKGIVSVDSKASVTQAIEAMLYNGVRRVLVSDMDMIITDRDIARYLLPRPTVDEFRENPQQVLARPISNMTRYMRRPAIINQETDIKTVLRALLTSEAHCIVTHDKQLIITPWDVTAKFASQI